VFDFDRIERTPNTLNAHRLIRQACAIGREGDAVEAVFSAYFCDGRDIGDIATLAEIGAGIGLNRSLLFDHLASEDDMATVLADNARAHRLGVNGVPCLILDGQYALAGAQEPDILLRLIDIVREAEAEAAFS
jgi:predicted DsbA family dithiol-disulfide isomerase